MLSSFCNSEFAPYVAASYGVAGMLLGLLLLQTLLKLRAAKKRLAALEDASKK